MMAWRTFRRPATLGRSSSVTDRTGRTATLSYDATHAYLNLVLSFIPPPGSGLSGNQNAVGNAIVNYFNSNGGIPIIYSALTAGGLTQASGETAAGSQATTGSFSRPRIRSRFAACSFGP